MPVTQAKKRYFYIDYIGCERRKLDTQRILDYLKKNEYIQTTKINAADVCVLVTCGFRNMYEEISLTKLHRILKNKQPNARIVVSGCMASIDPERMQQMAHELRQPDLDLVEIRNFEKLDEIFSPKVPFCQIPDPNTSVFDRWQDEPKKKETYSTPEHVEYMHAKKHYKIRIDEGCLGNCSYCVTKMATKQLKSKPIEAIIEEFKCGVKDTLTKNGNEQIIFLTGDDTGAYGLDMKLNITILLEKLFQIPGNYSVFCHDFGINWLMRFQDDLIPLFKKYESKLGCFNFPVQHASNRILELMRRPYKIEGVYDCLKALKKEVPSFKIGTHLLIGFPGETEEDFLETIKFVSEITLDFLVVFQYSDNPKSDASKLPNKIDKKIIEQRMIRLQQAFLHHYKETH